MAESVYESEELYDPADSVMIDEVLLDDEGVPEDLKTEFLKKPGRHLLGIGQTESGKTQKAYWFCKKLLPYEVIAWFERDEPDLVAYNRYYKKLDTRQAICWFPKRRFKDHWNFKMYYAPDGLEITYNGAL